MKQKLLILLMAIVVVVRSMAFDFSCVYSGHWLYFTKTSNNTCEVTNDGYTNTYFSNIVIPTSVSIDGETIQVTSIGANAFRECSKLTSIEIPNSITSIGDYAFNGCNNITTIVIPNSVTSIGFQSFSDCSNLSSVELPNSLSYIGDGAFADCSALTTVQIPNAVTSLGKFAFQNCIALVSVTISNSLTSIGERTFAGCRALSSVVIPESVSEIGNQVFGGCSSLSSIVIPNSVEKIGASAFFGCSSLSSVELPNSISSIGNCAFSECSGLTSFRIPNTVTSVGYSAFSHCSGLVSFYGKYSSEDNRCLIVDGKLNSFAPSGLTAYRIPNYVIEIGEQAFYGCSELKSIEIPNTVISIGITAFCGCIGLTDVLIPNTVTFIGAQAFGECVALQYIKVKNDNPSNISLGNYVFEYIPKASCVLYVPHGVKTQYSTANQWKDFSKIEEYTDEISLIDGTAYTNTEHSESIDVMYTRTFGNTNWQPLYLPFAMNYDEWAPYADVAELYNVRGYDPDNDGEIDEVTIEFNRLKEGASIQPNIPYVIKAKGTGKVTFECKDKLVTAAPATEGMVECSSTKFTYAFHGIYEEKTDLFSTGAYFLSKGNFYQAANENVKLAPYRAYLTVTPKTGGYNGNTTPAKAPQRITLVVDGEEETEGIEDIIDTAPHEDVYYDLMGRKVVNPTSGIYIQNGRKVYIK